MCVKLGSSIHRYAMSDKSSINIGLVSRRIGNDEIRYPELYACRTYSSRTEEGGTRITRDVEADL